MPDLSTDPALQHAWSAFLPPTLLAALDAAAERHPTIPGLRVAPGLQDEFPALEGEALAVVVAVYRGVKHSLAAVLRRRAEDRAFLDAGTLDCAVRNRTRSVRDPDWETVIGRCDATGRVVIGPLPNPPAPRQVTIPAALKGAQVTLFGPPDSPRLAINAMNALSRRRSDEAPIVAELVAHSGQLPRWGADSEDSKTPIGRHLLRAHVHLAACVDGSLTWTDPSGTRTTSINEQNRSIPIKRVAGLALPDGNHLLDGIPLPLHLVELVLHTWCNRQFPHAQIVYFPKLENEEEAAYVAELLDATQTEVRARMPEFNAQIRVLIVFENPRAIFRIREMAAAMGEHFLGGSLGWHDFLASTARLFRFDPGYRIPVKADPNIVVRHIRESHHILVRDLGPMGALKLGGMYGVLPVEGDPLSLEVARAGFVRDVVTQLKRGLDGYWVAHPDFVRIGIALVEAWRRTERDSSDRSLDTLIRSWVSNPAELKQVLAIVLTPDSPGLSTTDPRYSRAVLAAELGGSDVIANHDPGEVRYNVFQALQYLADWLCGNGCVALPATLRSASGADVLVRVMDDLATTERSRWELWAEVFHGRVSVALFDKILQEEMAYLQVGKPDGTRVPQVRWEGEAARWYPIAGRLLRQLVITDSPPEFVTELLLPFAHETIRDSADPWAMALRLCPWKYAQIG